MRTVRFMWRVADTKLSDIAKVSAAATPDDIAKLGFMVGDVIKAYADTLDEIGKVRTPFCQRKTDGFGD